MALFTRAIAYNMDAHRANPANLMAGALGMLVNNVIFFAGFWAMLFAGKPQNAELLPYFVALACMVMTSWGFVTFFFGGLRWIGDYVVEGTLEPMLATPRDVIYLAAISRSQAIALGDLSMGVLGILAIALKLGVKLALLTVAGAAISAIGFAALFVLTGAVALFVPRGNHIGQLLVEMTISMSTYPTGKMFSGAGRIVLLLTPAAVAAVLPIEAVEEASWRAFALAIAASFGAFAGAVGIFRLGLRRYRAVSLIGAQG